jgi:hypothetical protein
MQRMLCAAAMVIFGAAAFAQGPADALMTREQAMLQAIEKKDWTTFKQIVTLNALNLDENGAMSVSEFLKVVGDPKTDFNVSMTATEMKVIDAGANTKIVTYKLSQKGAFMGQPFPPMVYASTVWVNQGGTWRAVFHQESRMAPQQPQQSKK